MHGFDSHTLYRFFDLSSRTIDQPSIDEYLTKKYPVRFLTLLWDVCHVGSDAWTHIRSILEQTTKESKVILLLSDWLRDKKEVYFTGLDVEVHFVNGIGLTLYHDIFEWHKCVPNPSWNPSNKFLFLTGKYYKPNRYGLFKKLLDANLIKNSVYSLYLPKDHPDSLYNNNPDNSRTLISDTNVVHHVTAVPFDNRLYAETGFRVISETEYEVGLSHIYEAGDDPWITEKSWITILNKHPFIMAGQKGTLAKLKRMGYKTFEEYLPYSYDTAPDDERLDLVVENVKYWVENLSEDIRIRRDTEHNYRQFINQSHMDFQKISAIIAEYCPNADFRDVIRTSF